MWNANIAPEVDEGTFDSGCEGDDNSGGVVSGGRVRGRGRKGNDYSHSSIVIT